MLTMYGSHSMSSLNYSHSNVNTDWDPEASRASLAEYADSIASEAQAAAAWEEMQESMRIKRQETELKKEAARVQAEKEHAEAERLKAEALAQQKAEEEAHFQKLLEEDPEIPPWHRETAAHHTKPAWLLDILVAVAKKEEHEHDDLYAIYRQPHLLPQRPELLLIQKAALQAQQSPDKMFKSPRNLPLKKEAAVIRMGKAAPVASTTLLLQNTKQEPPTPVQEEFYYEYEEVEEIIEEVHEEIHEEEIVEEDGMAKQSEHSVDFIDELLSDEEEEEEEEIHEIEEIVEEEIHDEEEVVEEEEDEEEVLEEEEDEEEIVEEEEHEEDFIDQLLSDDEEEEVFEEVEIHEEEKPVNRKLNFSKKSSPEKKVLVGKAPKESTEAKKQKVATTPQKMLKKVVPGKKQQSESKPKVTLKKVTPKSPNQPAASIKKPAVQQSPWKVKLKSAAKAEASQDNAEAAAEIPKPAFPFTKQDLKTSKPAAKLQQRDVLQKPSFVVSPKTLKTNRVADRIAHKPVLKTLHAPVSIDDCTAMKKMLNHRDEPKVSHTPPVWAQRDTILKRSTRNLLAEETEKKEATVTAQEAPRKTKEVETTEAETDEEEDTSYAMPWKQARSPISKEDLQASSVKEKLKKKPIIRKPSYLVSKEDLKSNVVKDKLEKKPVILKPSYLVSKEDLKSNVVKDKLEKKPIILKPSYLVSKQDLKSSVVNEKLKKQT